VEPATFAFSAIWAMVTLSIPRRINRMRAAFKTRALVASADWVR
jgi:hypothetical protein